jgi:4-amino-4-deoxy-L-arabinose transferase-like glycosyltransferase
MFMNNQTQLDRINNLFKYLLIAGASLFLLSFIFCGIIRMFYPYELEWMEGCSVEHVAKILAGKNIYSAPSLEFVPFIYAPLYYYISAIAAKIFGLGFLPLRLVSLLATIINFLLIFKFTKNETKSSIAGLISAGLFAATYEISGVWFDIARVDSLSITFVLSSIYLIRFKDKWPYFILSGIFAGFTFFTKQSTAIIFLPVAIYLLFTKFRKSLFFIFSFLIFVSVTSYILNIISGGWFNYYVFNLPGQHGWYNQLYLHFWTNDIMKPMAVPFFVALIYGIFQFIEKKKKDGWFYFAFFAGMAGFSWLSRLHIGGYYNVLIPVFCILSLLFGLGYCRLTDLLKSMDKRMVNYILIFINTMFIAQFMTLTYNPMVIVPNKFDLKTGKEFSEKIAKIDGEVLILSHSYISRYSGKKSYAHRAAIYDVIRSKGPIRDKFENEFLNAFKEHKFSAVVIDIGWDYPELKKFYQGIYDNYKLSEKIFNITTNFYTTSGFKTRPELIYLPK